MISVERLLEAALAWEATFELEGGQVFVSAPAPLPTELMAQLRTRKTEIAARLRHQREQRGFVPWMLQEWRRVSIPDWRRILQESTDTGDHARADYARWMLRDILFDPEYED